MSPADKVVIIIGLMLLIILFARWGYKKVKEEEEADIQNEILREE